VTPAQGAHCAGGQYGRHQAALVTDVASDRTHDILMALLGRHDGAAVVFRWAGIDAQRTGAGGQERGDAHGGTGAFQILSVGALAGMAHRHRRHPPSFPCG
jgi:hypothetical protein